MKRLMDWIDLVIKKLIIGLFTFMTIITIIQVFCRYILGFSITWSGEVARYSLVWIAFAGGSLAYKENELIGVRFVLEKLPLQLRKIAIIINKLFIILFLVVVIIYGYLLVLNIMGQTSPAANIPMIAVYGIIPVGSILMLIHVILSFFYKNQDN